MAYSKYNYDSLGYVKFGTRMSYTYYGLVLASVNIEKPKRITSTIKNTITGNEIDVTDQVYPTPTYKNRKIQFTFLVIDAKEKWNDIDLLVSHELNGIMVDDIYVSEKKAHYSGRCSINKFKTNRLKGIMVIDVDASPYARYDVGIESKSTTTASAQSTSYNLINGGTAIYPYLRDYRRAWVTMYCSYPCSVACPWSTTGTTKKAMTDTSPAVFEKTVGANILTSTQYPISLDPKGTIQRLEFRMTIQVEVPM